MRLQADGIEKRYGPGWALHGVSLELEAGEIHALLGENGAGKSTLARLLGGVEPPDAGRFLLDGRPYTPRGPAAALRLGVARVGPATALAESLTVEENIALGLEPARGGVIDRRSLREQVRQALAELQSEDLDPRALVRTLSLPDRQRVELARALRAGTRLLILDEPTRSLSHWETGPLFLALRRMASRGVAILYISHFLEESQALCSRYTVLRDGGVAASGSMAAARRADLLDAMAGGKVRELREEDSSSRRCFGRVLLRLQGVSGKEVPRRIDLTLHAGEILGLAGLDGAGRREMLRTVMGRARLREGSIWRGGPMGMAISGAAEDGGLFEDLPLADNLTLPTLSRFSRCGFLSLEHQGFVTLDWMGKLRIRARSPRQPARTLSGGARQKVRLGRLLMQGVSVFLLDEPTRGIDLRSKLEIYALMDAIAAEGRGILWVGSDPAELLRVCDTIALLRQGRLVDLRPAGEWTEPEIIAAALGPP